MSTYPGAEEGYFYIFATDGVRSSGIDSPWVKVPYKAPDIITEQSNIPEYKITDEILLDVDIYDMQDGWLWDSEVVWTLDGREFMSGSTLWVWSYEIAPGTHTFSCTATNSAGMSVSKNFTFRIIDDESDLPDDWSREFIKDALSNGFITSLSRIDGSITRSQYASLMALLYVYMLEYEFDLPDYIENMVTDSGDDDYNEFFMVYLGVMDAPDGRFEPNGALTQQEAATIMYRIYAMAVDPDFNAADISDSEILEILENAEIFGVSAENAFQANERLTNKLALVRLSLLFDAVFGARE